MLKMLLVQMLWLKSCRESLILTCTVMYLIIFSQPQIWIIINERISSIYNSEKNKYKN